MRVLLTFFLALASVFPVMGQDGDLSLIQFSSAFEEEVFSNLENTDPVDLLLAIDPEMTREKANGIRRKIKAVYTLLDRKNIQSKNEEKQVKLLFNETHTLFFEKYINISNFSEIFNTREYNCVSATALYTLVLDHYSIPYEVKELPTHVYTVAYPNTKNILLESTAPKGGYYSPSSSDIQKSVKGLLDMKHVTRQELDEKGAEKIWYEKFFSQETITTRDLAGIQYYNEALSFMSKDKHEEALNSVRKAEMLTSGEKYEYLRLVLIGEVLGEEDFGSMEKVRLVTEYSNLAKTNMTIALAVYQNILQEELTEKENTAFVDSAYQYLQENIDDEIIRHDLALLNSQEYVNYYIDRSDYRLALAYSEKLYELEPENKQIQVALSEVILKKHSRNAGSSKALDEINEYEEKYSFLTENALYQSFKFYNYNRLAFMHLQANDGVKGFEYLSKMEELYEKFGERLQANDELFGLAYAEAGAYYYRKKYYRKAKDVLLKGLKILPDHAEIKVRLEIVEEEL